ncbi:MAG: tripartite tricarboxylate transporter substrate-binding protein [Hydrogenophaga sp.]|nr:tripartite tricarboxylate transporter substrate-binding protein [Hydrogenophaga sp.]
MRRILCRARRRRSDPRALQGRRPGRQRPAGRADPAHVHRAQCRHAAVKAGKLKALAVTSQERMGALPEVPAVHEVLADFEYLGWVLLFAPTATPAPVTDALAALWAQARNQPAIKGKLEGLGMYPPTRYASRDSLGALLKAEKARTAQLVKKLGITPV